MLLTITNTMEPATDLGYLLHKNPSRLHQVEIAAGQAYVFYPTASQERCTAALLLDIDPVALVRELEGPKGDQARLVQYVNDRPYVASSFMSVAISRAFGSALKGSSRERPELVSRPLPLEAELSVVRCAQGEDLLHSLFEPLGYAVETEDYPLDPAFAEWGRSPYFTLRLCANVTLRSLLNHLYVLIPVLDDDKHYWVTSDEVDKLLRAGEGWLKDHPMREVISKRYLRHQRRLVSEAMLRLAEEDDPDPEQAELVKQADEDALEQGLNLNARRMESVIAHVMAANPARVIDLGCGDGKLLEELMRMRSIPAVAGMDVSAAQLKRTARRLRLDKMPDSDRGRLTLFQGSLMYRDDRLKGYDVATLVEVIEHMDEARLAAFERVVFEYARPRVLIVTTPNAEYNAMFRNMPAHAFRHRDHRFEWNRRQFADWLQRVGELYGYGVSLDDVGTPDPALGPPTQLAMLTRAEGGT